MESSVGLCSRMETCAVVRGRAFLILCSFFVYTVWASGVKASVEDVQPGPLRKVASRRYNGEPIGH